MTTRHRIIALSLALLAGGVWTRVAIYDNYHAVLPNERYRSGQVSASEMSGYIARDGLATVINLRHDTNATGWAAEKDICRRENVTHLDLAMYGADPPTSRRDAHTGASDAPLPQTPVDSLQTWRGSYRTGSGPVLISNRRG